MTAVQALPSRLRRAIVMRQESASRWRVEGLERLDGRWLFTWLLVPATTLGDAEHRAETIAREMGLPVARQPLGRRMELCTGVLGAVA